MAREAMLKIKAAEEKAQGIRDDAATKAAEMIATAESEGLSSFEKARDNAEAVNRQKLELITAHANELIETTRTESRAEAAKMNRFTLSKRRDAVKLIVQGIFEQCQ